MQNNENTGVLDAQQSGILDLLVSKQWAIKLAADASRTVLSVDQIIVARQAGGPKPPGPNPVSVAARLPSRTPTSQGPTLTPLQNWDED